MSSAASHRQRWGCPVALAFGVASGLGERWPAYTGQSRWVSSAAVFGGTRSQISGPTGPMAVAMAAIVTSHADNLAEAFTIAIMAGLIQILLGALRIGRFVSFTPYSVISGFMSGIGIIIILVHILPFLGPPVTTGGPVGAVRARPEVISEVNLSTLAIAAVTLVVGVVWPGRLRRFLPPTPGGADRQDAAGRPVVERHAGDWRGANRPAERAIAGSFPQRLGGCRTAGLDHCAARLHRQPAYVPGNRFDDAYTP